MDKILTIPRDCAARLECLRNFHDEEAKKDRIAGDEWLIFGPCLYIPKIEVKLEKVMKPEVIKSNQALKIRARRDCKDSKGEERKAGDYWLIRDRGFYLPAIDEDVIEKLNAHIITESFAIHLRANEGFTDIYGNERKYDEEWLISSDISTSHIIDVHEDFVQDVPITILSSDEYCYINDPVNEKGVNQLGKKILRCGPCSFFVRPGESIDGGIRRVYILTEHEALLLKAIENFVEEDGTERLAGDRWMVNGPARYTPVVTVEIIEKRNSIAMDKNEGIYVRNIRTGSIRSIKGDTYMLKAHEELWEMQLDSMVQTLLGIPETQKTNRLVSYHCPFNAAVQVYDYKNKTSRVVFGPDIVTLEPDEVFTVSYLSGGKPKKPGVFKTLHINIGPDFFSDIFTVATSDHARLRLQLSYNWHFDIDKTDVKSASKIFNVRDFIGDCCTQVASRVRGAVAAITFENFHKYSARTIRTSIFGLDENGKVNNRFLFKQNNLCLTNVDIKLVEPEDPKTYESLKKSVTLAIEITTNIQEAEAHRAVQKQEQEALEVLKKQKIEDDVAAESDKKKLLNIIAECDSIKSSGQAIADAKARADALKITYEAEVLNAELKAKAEKIRQDSEISYQRMKQELELGYDDKCKEIELNEKKILADIESTKFDSIIAAIGQDTIVDIANSGPELQAKLLESLGLSGYLMTDSNNPINLFSTAKGLIAGAGGLGEN
uniref:Major vault protein n=1 Tax=Euplotes harpa TaxID=151035 RepID=A0A7S3JLK9_9SPIT